MSLTAIHPYAALLLLGLPLLWRRNGRPLPVLHRALRTAIFSCLVLALMQPSLLHQTRGSLRVVVLDQRTHLSAAERGRARAAWEALRGAAPADDDLALLQIGGEPVDAGRARKLASAPDGQNSLSEALQRALGAVPQDRSASLTVISDGLSRDSHWGRTVRELISRGIGVDTIALAPAPRQPFISGLDLPPVRTGEQGEAKVTVDGNGQDLVVSLYHGGRRIAASLPFDVEGSTRVAIPFTAGPAGFTPLRAVIEGHAGSALETTIAIQDPLLLLYLGERQQGGGASLQALLGKGFAVEARPANGISGGFDFSAYRAVIIDDLPAARLPGGVQHRLLRDVAAGRTGLFYSGGQAAFGPGGYAGSPLAAALPVTLRQEDKLEKPSVALAVVIDTSGSMQGEPLDLAKQVARFAVRNLTAQDSVGVVEFFGARQWSVPMQPARDTADVERAIGRMQAQGGTVLYPAIQEAYFGLKNTQARYKHILVISDAGVEEARYEQLLRHIAQDRVNVSTVQVGHEGSDEQMADWARWGQGRYYAVEDETGIVQVRLNDPVLKPSPGYRHGSFDLHPGDGDGWWGGMSLAAMPPLGGYAASGTRPEAQTLLATRDGDPVLATWPYGAGRVTALMTEPLGEGTRPWRGWSGYGQWLGRIVARTADRQAPFTLQLERRFGHLNIEVRTGIAGAAPALRLLDAAGEPHVIRPALEERAPGLFTAEFPFPADRTARVEARLGRQILRAADRPHSDVAAGDRMPLSRALPLRQLSAMTNGTTAADAQALIRAAAGTNDARGALSALNLWSPLLLLALILYLVELAYRRWPRGGRSS